MAEMTKIQSLYDDAIPYITFIFPCYNEEASIPMFYDEVVKILTKINKQVELINVFVYRFELFGTAIYCF